MIHEHSRSITPAVGGASDTVERHGIIGMPGGTPPTVAAQCTTLTSSRDSLSAQAGRVLRLVHAGYRSQVRPSSRRPPAWGVSPPMCLENSEIRMLTQRSPHVTHPAQVQRPEIGAAFHDHHPGDASKVKGRQSPRRG